MKFLYLIVSLYSITSLAQGISIKSNTESPTLPYEYQTIKFGNRSYIEHFRNIESISDSILEKWLAHQNLRTKNKLWTLPEKNKWTTKLSDIGNRYESNPYMFRYGEEGSEFYLRYDIASDVTTLYSYDRKHKREKFLVSTDSLSQINNTSYYINYYCPSWDGDYLAVEFNDYSGLTGTLLLLDAKTGKILHEPFENSSPDSFGGISWLPDSSGFLYTRFPIIDSEVPGYKQKAESFLYNLGTSGIGSPVFSSAMVHTGDPKAYPAIVASSSHEKYPIGFMRTSDDYWDAFISDWESLKTGDPDWRPLYKRSDKVLSTTFKQVDSTFYFISGKTQNTQLLKVNLDAKNWSPKIVLEAPEGAIISDFAINKNGIYFTALRNGVKASLYHLQENQTIQRLDFPKESGEIYLSVLSPKDNILWAYSAGWTSELKRYRYSNGIFMPDNYDFKDIYTEFEDLEIIETEYVSTDNTEVPISIIRNPKYDGERPTIMVTYGAFGEKISPDFSLLYLPWVAQGGTLVYPHIRGGGEKGSEWYEAGKKSTKSNSWRDIIAAAEFLIDKKYATAKSIVLMSPSGGGVAGGMALNKAPELFQGYIGEMPILNPSRLEFGNFSNNYHLEFGSVSDSSEAGHLYAMDPLLNINMKKKLPNVLIISAGNDDRVDGFQMFKYVAALQKFDAAKSIYLYNDPDAAHAGVSDFYNVYGMVLGFAEHITK